MKRTLVAPITANFAKLKGFDWDCDFAIPIDEENPVELLYYDGDGLGSIKNSELDQASSGRLYDVAMPDQWLLQKWLRKEHNLHIHFNTTTDGKWYSAIMKIKKGVGILGGGGGNFNDKSTYYDTYEEALEDGLQQALKII